MCGGTSFSPGGIAGSLFEGLSKTLAPGGKGAGTQTSSIPKTRKKPKVTEETSELEQEIEEPAGDAATEVTKKYARRGRKANVLAGAMGGMNMERIRRRRMLGSFSEPMGQY
tara:strand:- start:87 stop:422 length:336 start_codon:yes stop_codon:yes gene_type:complete